MNSWNWTRPEGCICIYRLNSGSEMLLFGQDEKCKADHSNQTFADLSYNGLVSKDEGTTRVWPGYVWTSQSGAKSSSHHAPYHLIPWYIFATRLAERYGLGQEKYPDDPDGTPNYMKGLGEHAYVLDRANHMLDHAHKAVEELRSGKREADDNLAAVIWGAIFLMAAQKHKATDPTEAIRFKSDPPVTR